MGSLRLAASAAVIGDEPPMVGWRASTAEVARAIGGSVSIVAAQRYAKQIGAAGAVEHREALL